jgi:transcriptional regulator with PAS, ATPase and Fis domain
MEKVRAFARRAARVNAPVLLLGETGTGKSLLGRVIHHQSPRAASPYLAINCAGIPDSLFESEFFGHQRGAFTGAREGRKGFLEQAQRGSLFLDEVGELSTPQQAKLLTALEEGEIRRLGGEGTHRVDVRVLAATSRDLFKEMATGAFRRDLFHRLAVLVCHIPPLRERREDIPLLVGRLVKKYQARHGRPAISLPAESVEYLKGLPWPGNVRELAHILEAAIILSERSLLDREALYAAVTMGLESEGGTGDPSRSKLGTVEPEEPRGGTQLRRKRDGRQRYSFFGTADEEREAILGALTRSGGNKSRAAEELGMSRHTLRQRLTRYKLQE